MRFFLADGMWDSALARTASVRTYHGRTVGVRTSFVLLKHVNTPESVYTQKWGRNFGSRSGGDARRSLAH